MKTIRTFTLVLCLLSLSFGSAIAQEEVTITDLGTLGGAESSGSDINSVGQVVGKSLTVASDSHIFLWSEADGMSDLGTLGVDEVRGLYFNDSGQISGTYRSQPHPTVLRAFLWSEQSGFTDLGSLSSDYGVSIASDVNNLGEVVGSSATDTGTHHAYLWTPATGMIDLGSMGGQDSFAYGINDLGQVVGFYRTASGVEKPFLWSAAGGMNDLGMEAGQAWQINNVGQVIGNIEIADTGELHPFLWMEGSGAIDLGNLAGYFYCYPNSINNLGQVVGACETEDFSSVRAFLWTLDGGMQDLGTLGGDNAYAITINDLGQIIGTSQTSSGEFHATLWTIPSTQLPPEELTNLLIGDVYNLVDSGMLNQGQGNSLVVKLQNALVHLAKDNPKNTCNLLKAFSNQVNSLIGEGVLSSEDGESLLNSANEISIQVCE